MQWPVYFFEMAFPPLDFCHPYCMSFVSSSRCLRERIGFRGGREKCLLLTKICPFSWGGKGPLFGKVRLSISCLSNVMCFLSFHVRG